MLSKVISQLPEETEGLIHTVIGGCIAVHRVLGPGLLERIYADAISWELAAAGLKFEREKPFPVTYRGRLLYVHRLDLVIERMLVVEIKAVERLAAVHQAQLMSYLRISKLRVGLLINFNVAVLPDGLKRIVL